MLKVEKKKKTQTFWHWYMMRGNPQQFYLTTQTWVSLEPEIQRSDSVKHVQK